ncbi:MAG: DMT family transporter, partial [Patescibacteria group bacterium]
MWLIWTVVAYFFNAIAVLIDKSLFYTKTVTKPAAYVITICTLGLLVFILAPWGFYFPGVWPWFLSLGAGLCFTIALWLLFISLQKGEASRVTSFIGAWSPIFVLIASYLLINETLSRYEIMAFVFLVLGGFLIVSGRGGLSNHAKYTALASALSFALFYTLSKQVFTVTDFINGLIWIRIAAFAFALPLLFIPSTIPAIKQSFSTKPAAKFAFVCGQISAALSALVVNYAISLGSVSLVNALQGLQYVFLLFLVMMFSWKWPKLLSEEFSGSVLARKLAAIVLIVGGLSILAFV